MKMDEEEESINLSDSEVSGVEEVDASSQYDGNNSKRTEKAKKSANTLNVFISDKVAPIVVLFGPPACGKTMILVRLCRYLLEKGYSFDADRSFRGTGDVEYDDAFKHFCEAVDRNKGNAAKSTGEIDFLLLKVIDSRGKVICQLLEGPGELYFNRETPNASFPKFFYTVASSNNRKIWTIITESVPRRGDEEKDSLGNDGRRLYVDKINRMLVPSINRNDGTIIVYNKIDRTNLVLHRNEINISEARQEVSNLYPGIYSRFENTNPITKLFRPYNFDFVPFQTGNYNKSEIDSNVAFTEGADEYPQMLWNAILKQIKG